MSEYTISVKITTVDELTTAKAINIMEKYIDTIKATVRVESWSKPEVKESERK